MPEPVDYIKVGDLFRKDELPTAQFAEQLAHRLRMSEWLTTIAPEHELIHQRVAELATATTEAEFAAAWNSIMDEADYFRIRLDCIST